MTLLKSIDQLIENITVTDRQEEKIRGSISNINEHLLSDDSNLHVLRTFANGSWERDTIIRPLKDIDLFVVLDAEEWKDENGNPPNPQSVLTKFKNYLDSLNDYKGKVKQDRPCVTVELSDKDFDLLPAFKQNWGGYLIPNFDLNSWTHSDPDKLTKDLNAANANRAYMVKPTIKAIKYWNRENGGLIPSYHIEEVAILLFQAYTFKNYEESIRLWFSNAGLYLEPAKFHSTDRYNRAVSQIARVKDKLIDAKGLYDKGEEKKATAIWSKIFGDEFPAGSELEEEAKSFSKSLSNGGMRIVSAGTLSTAVGTPVTASSGFFGDVSKA